MNLSSLTKKLKANQSPTVRLLLAIFPIVLITLFVLFLNLPSPKEPEAPQQIVNQNLEKVAILLARPITGFYPQKAEDSYQQLFGNNLFNGLVNFRSGKVEAAVASSWENVDPTTWRFSIKKGQRFSNGSDLNLTDIQFSIQEAVAKRWPIEEPLFQINSVETVNNQIEIKTSQPIPDFLVMLSSIPILSQDHHQKKSQTDFEIGTGPFKLVKNDTQMKAGQITEQTLELIYNQYSSKKPNVNTVTYTYLAKEMVAQFTPDSLENSFQIIASDAVPDNLRDSLLTSSFSKTSVPKPSLGVLFINISPNTPDFPLVENPFASTSMRKALYMAINTGQLISEGNIKGKSTTQPASSFTFGYNPGIIRPATNLSETRKIFKEEGHEKDLILNLQISNELAKIGNLLAQQLNDSGMTVRVNFLSPEDESKKLADQNFTLYLGRWLNNNFTSTTTFTRGLKTTGDKNFTGYSNPQLDEKIALLSNTIDLTQRERILQELMSLATADYPWLSIWEDIDVILVNDKIDIAPSTSFIIGSDISGK